jgi:aspartyl-tRNA(Asn)/glutamyl-tRNA(Gln) amidotransferase subunit A
MNKKMNIPLTIKETQEGLVKKKFSAVQLVDTYLARIEKFDKGINSFLTMSDELAYLQAKEVDKKIEELGEVAFEKNPLLGVPIYRQKRWIRR